MHPFGFVIEQLTHGDERLREDRRRAARRSEARSSRSRRTPPRALGDRLDG